MTETWESFKARGIQGRVDAAFAGANPTVIARMQSGFAIMCDTQLLPGYAQLIPVPLIAHLHDLPLEKQVEFLRDMALVGRAVGDVTNCKRVMYGIFGGLMPIHHAHILPRYEWEGEDFKRDVAHAYPHRFEEQYLFSPEKHGDLRDQIKHRLLELMHEADAMSEKSSLPLSPTPRQRE